MGDGKGHLWRRPSCPRCFRNNPTGRADGRIGADPASCCMASCPRCDTRTVSQKMGESWVQCRRRGSWPTRGIWLTRGADPPRGSVQCAFVQSQVKTNRFQSHGPGHVRETERGAVAGLSAPFDSEGQCAQRAPVTSGPRSPMTQRSPGLPPWRRCQRAHGANSHAPRLQSPELITPTLKPRGAHLTPGYF